MEFQTYFSLQNLGHWLPELAEIVAPIGHCQLQKEADK